MNLNLDVVPTNLEEALTLIKASLTPKEVVQITESTFGLHFGLGMYLRNNWELWEPLNILNLWFKKNYGIDHADDISSIILECLHDDLNNRPRRDKTLANEYIEHWKQFD